VGVGVYGITTVQLFGFITIYITTAFTLTAEEIIAFLRLNSFLKRV
jgi:hypothetical protein